jgi:hypothetical protein
VTVAAESGAIISSSKDVIGPDVYTVDIAKNIKPVRHKIGTMKI